MFDLITNAVCQTALSTIVVALGILFRFRRMDGEIGSRSGIFTKLNAWRICWNPWGKLQYGGNFRGWRWRMFRISRLCRW